MALCLTKLRLAAAVLVLGALAFAAPSARAFTMENLSAGSDGSRFADQEGQARSGMTPFGQNGPTVQFGAGTAGSSYSPFRPFSGFVPSQPPPEPYNLNNRN
jgi:hypothetical protein